MIINSFEDKEGLDPGRPRRRGIRPSCAMPFLTASLPPRDCRRMGGETPSPHAFVDPPGFAEWSRQDQVSHRLLELRAVALQRGHQGLVKNLVEPWMDHAGPTGFPSKAAEPAAGMAAAAGAPLGSSR